MRVLITGANGFLGHHLTRTLVDKGVEVTAFDIVPPREQLPHVTYYTGSILDKETLIKRCKDCDSVFHLAAVLGVKRATDNLLKCMSVNIQGTQNVIEACVLSKVPHLLFTSSSEVFGDIDKEGLRENSPFNPKSGYAVSKLAGEEYLKAYHHEYGLNYNIVRLFNIYGPGQVCQFVVPRFISQVLKNVPPTIYGSGEQVRSFCHITDACRALRDICLDNTSHNDTFNIGNDTEPVSMRELAEKVIAVSGKDLSPNFVPFEQSDRLAEREIYYRVPNVDKIRKQLDYSPRMPLEQGIKNVMDSGDLPEEWTGC